MALFQTVVSIAVAEDRISYIFIFQVEGSFNQGGSIVDLDQLK